MAGVAELWDLVGNKRRTETIPRMAATVIRSDDDGTVWVMFDGASDETPVKNHTAEVKQGDTVMVSVANGRASIDGSITAPSVGKSGVNEVVVPVIRRVETVEADSMKVHDLTADQLVASTAYIGELEAESVAAHDIATDHATIGQLDATYAHIDAANIDTATIREAWVNAIMVQSGLIAHEGTVFTLDAIQVNAANVTAGTLDVERLMVTGQDGHKYLVHAEGGTTSYEKLDGDVIEDLTITADKIVAGAVTAEKITTENIAGSGGWINLRSGTFRYVNATTGQGIAWDGSNLTISGSVTVGGSPIALEQIAQDATNTLIYDHAYQLDASGENATFTAYLYRGGVDVKAEYDPEQFVWYYKTEADDTLHPIGTGYGYTCTVSVALMGYGGHVVGKFVQQADSDLLTSDDEALQDSDGDQLTAQTPVADGSVRVSDLQVATRVAATDKLLVSDQEGEHLVTMETLQGYIESRMPKHVLFGTTAQWNAQVSLESVAETMYVYTDHATDSQGNPIAGIKVGDGSAYLIDLPFTDTVMMEHITDNVRHVTAQERAFWNEKVRCYTDGSESLVFTTS